MAELDDEFMDDPDENTDGKLSEEEFDELSDEEADRLLMQDMFLMYLDGYKKDPSEKNFENLFYLLTRETIWVPFVAEFDKEDEEAMVEYIYDQDDFIDIKNLSYEPVNPIRLVPELVVGDELFLFPIYTSDWLIEQEYADSAFKLPMDIESVIRYVTRHSDGEVTGVVINPFTTELELDIPILKKIEERIREERKQGKL